MAKTSSRGGPISRKQVENWHEGSWKDSVESGKQFL